MYDAAADEGLRFFDQSDDCAAQCALVFGGGIAQWADYPLYRLLRWTDRAVRAAAQEQEA